MNWSHFLIAVRWQNVFIIWLMQTVVYFLYVLPYCGKENYSYVSFLLFICVTGAILGGGNIFNDIRDVHTDALHPYKPKLIGSYIPIPKAWTWYFWLNGLALILVGIGGWYYNWHPMIIIIFIIAAITLYVYSSQLKATIFVGNIVVALLCGVSVWMTTLLALPCELGLSLRTGQSIPLILYGYISNAFMITLLREVVKDKEDAPSDTKSGILTTGSIRDSYFRVVFNGILAGILLINGIWFLKLKSMLSGENWNLGIIIIFIPLILMGLLFNLPHKPKIYAYLSKLIKYYIFIAILLLILWQRS